MIKIILITIMVIRIIIKIITIIRNAQTEDFISTDFGEMLLEYEEKEYSIENSICDWGEKN